MRCSLSRIYCPSQEPHSHWEGDFNLGIYMKKSLKSAAYKQHICDWLRTGQLGWMASGQIHKWNSIWIDGSRTFKNRVMWHSAKFTHRWPDSSIDQLTADSKILGSNPSLVSCIFLLPNYNWINMQAATLSSADTILSSKIWIMIPGMEWGYYGWSTFYGT